MCAGKYEVCHMTLVSFIIIFGEKNASALGTSGGLFLTKMWCLFCFNNWKLSSFQATGGIIIFCSVLVASILSLYRGKAMAGKSMEVLNPLLSPTQTSWLHLCLHWAWLSSSQTLNQHFKLILFPTIYTVLFVTSTTRFLFETLPCKLQVVQWSILLAHSPVLD